MPRTKLSDFGEPTVFENYDVKVIDLGRGNIALLFITDLFPKPMAFIMPKTAAKQFRKNLDDNPLVLPHMMP